jgi:hypothetical protein
MCGYRQQAAGPGEGSILQLLGRAQAAGRWARRRQQVAGPGAASRSLGRAQPAGRWAGRRQCSGWVRRRQWAAKQGAGCELLVVLLQCDWQLACARRE